MKLNPEAQEFVPANAHILHRNVENPRSFIHSQNVLIQHPSSSLSHHVHNYPSATNQRNNIYGCNANNDHNHNSNALHVNVIHEPIARAQSLVAQPHMYNLMPHMNINRANMVRFCYILSHHTCTACNYNTPN